MKNYCIIIQKNDEKTDRSLKYVKLLKKKTIPVKIPVEYLMDPQEWNPKCNKYPYSLTDIISQDANKKKKEAVEKAYYEYFKEIKKHKNAIKEAKNKLIGDLQKGLGKEDWDRIMNLR